MRVNALTDVLVLRGDRPYTMRLYINGAFCAFVISRPDVRFRMRRSLIAFSTPGGLLFGHISYAPGDLSAHLTSGPHARTSWPHMGTPVCIIRALFRRTVPNAIAFV